MRLTPTLYLYIAKNFLKIFLVIFLVITFIIFLGDFLELSRKAADKNIYLSYLIKLAILKNPEASQQIFPFCFMLATLLSFTKLSRNSELIIMRSSGFSIIDIATPVILTGLFLGVIFLIFINPISASMIKKYHNIENRIFKNKVSFVSISKSGLWLKQENYENKNEEIIIRASRLANNNKSNNEQNLKKITLLDVTIFFMEKGSFMQRIDASKVSHLGDFWHLENVLLTQNDGTKNYYNEFFIQTKLSIEDIYNSFVSPENINFWELPKFIATMKKSGFSAISHELEFFNLLFSPIYFCAMILLGICFSVTHIRNTKQNFMIVLSLAIGFFIYFVSNLIYSFGLSGNIPIVFASIIPIILIITLALYFLLYIEER